VFSGKEECSQGRENLPKREKIARKNKKQPTFSLPSYSFFLKAAKRKHTSSP